MMISGRAISINIFERYCSHEMQFLGDNNMEFVIYLLLKFVLVLTVNALMTKKINLKTFALTRSNIYTIKHFRKEHNKTKIFYNFIKVAWA